MVRAWINQGAKWPEGVELKAAPERTFMDSEKPDIIHLNARSSRFSKGAALL